MGRKKDFFVCLCVLAGADGGQGVIGVCFGDAFFFLLFVKQEWA